MTVLLQQETTRHVYGPGDIISAENGFKLTSPFKKKKKTQKTNKVYKNKLIRAVSLS